MLTDRRRRFVHAQVAWMLATIVLLTALRSFSLELTFLLSLLGLLVVVGLTSPVNVTPAWRSRLRWILGLGLFVFAGIVVRRLIEILPPGVI